MIELTERAKARRAKSSRVRDPRKQLALKDRARFGSHQLDAQVMGEATDSNRWRGPGPASVRVRVPNGLAWHPDWDSCLKLQQCAAQRPGLPSLTVPIDPIGTLTRMALPPTSALVILRCGTCC